MYEQDPDVKRMLAFKEGSEGAFEELFQKYKKPLINYIYRFVGSQAAAEELTQEVFLKVYRYGHRYQPTARFSTWLYRIATNVSMNELRRGEHKNPIHSIDTPRNPDAQGAGIDLPDKGRPDAYDSLAGRRLEEAVRAVVAELPEKQKAAVILSKFQGLTYEEIAESLGCSIGAVKSLIHRGMGSLNAKLKPFLESV